MLISVLCLQRRVRQPAVCQSRFNSLSKESLIRGHKVMVDIDLADLYEVSTKALNQAVKRSLDRFPPDFMFQLTSQE